MTIQKRCAALALASLLVVASRPDLAAQGLKLRVIQNAMAGDAVTIIDPATNTVVGEIPDLLAIELVRSAARRIQAADHVHERRFARARRPHDGDVLPSRNVEIDPRQGMHVLAPDMIDLGDAAKGDEHG